MLHSKFGIKEFGNVDLGDRRLDRRLIKMANAAVRKPKQGFPRMMSSDAELEATYRFFNNPRITPEKILASHTECTSSRCKEHSKVWIAHDTTEFRFGGESQREGLGKIKGMSAGFSGHFSLAVVPGEARDTLGLLNVELVNDTKKIGMRSVKARREASDRQSKRWEDGVVRSTELLGNKCQGIHIMDREADSYPLWAFMVEGKQDFVIRVSWNRKIVCEQTNINKLFDLLDESDREPWVLKRSVRISARGRPVGNPKYKKRHPKRHARNATLGIRAMPVTVKRTLAGGEDTPESLDLQVVRIREIKPPKDQVPIEWHLITTLPIDTEEQLAQIVDAYRGRWIIEEYFKALKTGCSFEKRQLESYDALTLALALLSPVAWRLLRLKTLNRESPTLPASKVMTRTQLEILKEVARDPLPDNPTVEDVLFAVARLGGFLKHNKTPGWQTIGNGFHELLSMEMGWYVREQTKIWKRSDQ